jgi:hypothetical protein
MGAVPRSGLALVVALVAFTRAVVLLGAATTAMITASVPTATTAAELALVPAGTLTAVAGAGAWPLAAARRAAAGRTR